MFSQIRSVRGEVVRTAGALRRARPTFRYMGSSLFLTDLLTGHEPFISPLLLILLLLLLSSGGARAGLRARARTEGRFMGSFNEFRTRAHWPMNRALQVGRALRRPPPKPCCEKFPQIRSVHGEVVRTGGAQRSARPTLRFMGEGGHHRLRREPDGPQQQRAHWARRCASRTKVDALSDRDERCLYERRSKILKQRSAPA